MTKKILLIEDDHFLSDLYKVKLEAAGCEVWQAFDGLTGLTQASFLKPDLILLDLMMPVYSGLEVLKKLTEKEVVKETPTVVLSNMKDDEIIKKARDLGAVGYLVKTALSPDQVVDEVLKHLPSGSNLTPTD